MLLEGSSVELVFSIAQSLIGIAVLIAFAVFLGYTVRINRDWQRVIQNNTDAFNILAEKIEALAQRLGDPAGLSMSADIADIKKDTRK